MGEYFFDKNLRIDILPMEIKQMIALNLLLDPINAIDILKECNKNHYKDLICDNRQIYELLWSKYISKNKDEYEGMDFNNFKILVNDKLKLYYNPYKVINDKNFKKYEILYNNIKNNVKILLLLNRNISDSDKIKLLIEKIDYVYDVNILTFAVEYNDKDIIQLLLNKGADATRQNSSGMSAISSAAAYNYEILKLFVENGVNVNTRNDKNQSLLWLAVNNNKYDAAKLLIKNGAKIYNDNNNDKDLLNIAAYISDLNMVKLLVENGADLNFINEYDHNPLASSLINFDKTERIKIFEYLLYKGADIFIKNKRNETILFEVVRGDYIELAERLINLGLNVNDKNIDGKKLISYSRSKKMYQLLATKGLHQKLKSFKMFHRS